MPYQRKSAFIWILRMERIRTQFGSIGFLETLKEGAEFLDLTLQNTSYFSSNSISTCQSYSSKQDSDLDIAARTCQRWIQPQYLQGASALQYKRALSQRQRNIEKYTSNDGRRGSWHKLRCDIMWPLQGLLYWNIRMQLEYCPVKEDKQKIADLHARRALGATCHEVWNSRKNVSRFSCLSKVWQNKRQSIKFNQHFKYWKFADLVRLFNRRHAMGQ